MPEHPFFARRVSTAKGPDYSTKKDVTAVLAGEKKLPNEADYRPASEDSRKRCSECSYYKRPGNPESDCSKVVGIVKGEGYCDLFELRKFDPPVGIGSTIIVQVKTDGV